MDHICILTFFIGFIDISENFNVVHVCRSGDGSVYTGVYTVNNELHKAKRLLENEIAGPESFEADKDGT